MPNIWTHLIFGRELLHKLDKMELIESQTNGNIFNLGCQGPDFLFYHNFLPWKKGKQLSELGSRIHHEKCGPFLLEMMDFARNRLHAGCQQSAFPSKGGGHILRQPLAVYTLGFLTHHVLDRNMHPYIYYKSGFKKWDHQRFEVIMDTLMAKKFLGIETWKTPVWKQFDVGSELPDGVAAMFEKITGKVFPDAVSGITSSDWSQAYRDMISAQKLFHDPTGVKRILTANQIEPLMYKKKNAPLDYLNEAKQAWNHPVSKAETYNTSVWDLWEQALADGEAVLQHAFSFLTAEKGAAADEFIKLASVVGDISYDTGKPSNSGLQNQFVNPIL